MPKSRSPEYWKALERMNADIESKRADQLEATLKQMHKLEQTDNRDLPKFVNEKWLHPYTENLYIERLKKANTNNE